MLISDLRVKPVFVDIVADRIWHAFWHDSGQPQSYIAGRVREGLAGEGIPFVLVAHGGERFLGTASVIVSDSDERPDLSPWIAAVWVEPDAREQGIGGALLEHATAAAFRLGVERLYLGAGRLRRPFYEKRGWVPYEENVGPNGLTILRRGSMSQGGGSGSPL